MKSPVFVILACIFPLLFSGCVSKATYQRKADQADVLASSIEGLETDYQSLLRVNGDLVTYNDELDKKLEESRQQNAALQDDLVRARADLDRMDSILSARNAEAGAAMTQMRQDIDRLETANRELTQELEQEKIAREARLAQLKSTYDKLVDNMEEEISRGEITISELQGKLTVNMVERILFDSGKADIKKNGLAVLKRVGDVLKEASDKDIRVEGHTDNVPISSRLKDVFPSNWELSTARATNVVRFLQKDVGISGSALAACGYGEFRPVADNATAEGRAQNRRIQIVLVPKEGQLPQ